jgi:hypothetical protein
MIKNKNILFIGSSYFGYSEEIVKTLSRKGAKVTYFPDDPYDFINARSLSLGIGRYLRNVVFKYYRSHVLTSTRPQEYDYIVFLKGIMMSHEFMTLLRQQNPDSKFIYYSWDSINNFDYTAYRGYFHKVSSFDSKDCTKWGFDYLQLFAMNEFYKIRESQTKKDVALLLLGQYRPERLALGNAYKKLFSAEGETVLIKLYAPFLPFLVYGWRENGISFIKKLLNWNKNYKGISFFSISSTKWQHLLSRSIFCLDVPHSAQTGMTMRTFEAIAAGCYLISTNKNLQNEPFYNPESMSIIDHTEASIPDLRSFAPIPFDNYSIDTWVDRLLTIH